MEFDLRWVTAICQITTGLVACSVVAFTWWMAPHERAERFGPYLTAEGLRKLLTNLPNGFLFGLFLIISGTSKWMFYSGTIANPSEAAIALSILEAGFGVAIVAILLWKSIRAA